MPLKINDQINLKVFLINTLIANAIVLFFAQNLTEAIVFIGIYLASLLNFYMLYIGGREIKRTALLKDGERADKSKVVYMFVGKLFVLFIALSLGVHFIGNKIIIPLLNYVIHIFILAFSLRDKKN